MDGSDSLLRTGQGAFGAIGACATVNGSRNNNDNTLLTTK